MCTIGRQRKINAYIWKEDEAIIKLLNTSQQVLESIAKNMKELGNSLYSWEQIAKQYTELF